MELRRIIGGMAFSTPDVPKTDMVEVNGS